MHVDIQHVVLLRPPSARTANRVWRRLRRIKTEGSSTPALSLQLVMNVPFTAIYFTTYESAKKLLNQAEDREEGLLTQLTAGGAAGAERSFRDQAAH